MITEVGPNLRAGGERVIDAGDCYVTPGFIDVHTHLDPSLFWDPLADPLPQHGITSVVTGNCSLSLVPIKPADRDGMIRLFSYIEDFPEHALRDAIPWDWNLWDGYRDSVDRVGGFTVNSAGLVGHTALRVYVMGDDAWHRPASALERDQMGVLLDEALTGGAFGLSTSFFDEDPDSRPVPSRLADEDEFGVLYDVLERHRALVQFVPEWLGDPLASIERLAVLARGRDVTVTWTGIVHDERRETQMLHMLDRTAELAESGVRLIAQYSPRTVDARISWERSMVFMALSKGWHRIIGAPVDEQRRMLADPAWRDTARAEWDATTVVKFPTRRLEKARLVAVGRPEFEEWIGRSVADLVTARGGHPSDVLADWLLDNDMNAGVVLIGLYNDDPEGVAKLLTHPAVIAGASDAGAHVAMACTVGDSTLLLSRHVRDRGDLSLEDGVAQLTGRAAALVGISDRGVIAPGRAADLTVFNLDELAWLPDELVDDVPGGGLRFRRDAAGYRCTIVNGVVTQEGGQLTGARPAGLLTRAAM
jgi:N-acyl-D-aspartate/D-glutamate deacylase